MPVRRLCQDFFREALGAFHKYRQNALIDATTALVTGLPLTLTSIGRFLPGGAQVKNKIKRVARLLGNGSLQQDVPMIFNKIISMLTNRLSLCVIAVDWSGYPSQEYHALRASLIGDGRSIPSLSHAPSGKQNNGDVQKAFLNALARTISPDKKIIIITDAGFKNAWFRHIKSLGWDFVGRIRGNTQLRLECKTRRYYSHTGQSIWGPEHFHRPLMLDVTAIFIFRRQNRKAGSINGPAAVYEGASRFAVVAQQRKSPSSTAECKPREIMK